MKGINNKLIFILYIAIIVFLLYFILFPVISVILYGVNSSGGEGTVFNSENFIRSFQLLRNSIKIGIVVTVLATTLGLIMAFTLNRIKFKGRGLFRVLALLPFVNPPFVGSVAFIMLFGRRGLISNKILGLSVSPYGSKGIIVIQVLGLSALAYILISSAIKRYDTTFEDAARNLGAPESKIFRTVMLPLMFPEISSTALLVFLASMSDFSTPIIIGGDFQTLASDLYIQITGLYDMKAASIAGIILLIPCLGLFLFHKYYLKRKSYFSDDIVSIDLTYKNINLHWKRILISITVGFIGIVVIKYIFIIIGAFTRQWGYDYEFTLDHFKALSGRQIKPFVNSVKLASVTALISSIMGIIIAYLIKMKRVLLGNLIDLLATLPAAVPGILFGIGYLVAFRYPIFGVGRWIFTDQKPWILLGTGIIIYIIIIARYINTALKSGYALLEHIDPDIENASLNLGAGELTTFFKVTMPLLKDGFFAAFLRSFSSGMVTLGAIIFLLLPSNRVAVQQIFTVITSSSIGSAAAMSLSLSFLTLTLLGIYYMIFNFNTIISKVSKIEVFKWKSK